MIEQALRQALEPIKDGKVHAAIEPIPKEAVPCLQIFRGRLIKFYSYLGHHNGYKWFYIPTIRYQNKSAMLTHLSIPESNELIAVNAPMEEMDKPMVEARILSISDGESCRKFQQALVLIAQQDNK